MLRRFYTGLVFRHPRAVLALVLLVVALMATQATKLQIDASAQTLLLENDKDLAYTRLIAKRYRTPDFLVITYTPQDGLFSDTSLKAIADLSRELEALDAVDSVTSIRNVPMLQSPPKPVDELLEKIPTIGAGEVNLTLAAEEFRHNPLYARNLVSPDLKTTALRINLKYDAHYFDLLDRVDAFKGQKERNATGNARLARAQATFDTYRDSLRETEHATINAIRAIMQGYKSDAELFLGGVNMIADDMITFVKRDLRTYGVIVLFLLIAVLWIVFRQLQWVALPVAIAAISILCSIGLLGLLGWEVTVISSNFIALQLIITFSIIIHLIVRYREESRDHADAPQSELVLKSTLAMSTPTFFAVITTIAGFGSLMLSGIKPVTSLGLMMSAGIAISLVIAYLVFPAVMILRPRCRPNVHFEAHYKLTRAMADAVRNRPALIYASTLLVAIFAITGSQRLIVENSFINYFKPSTEIYQGMTVIDRQLGGTTPLDVVIDFGEDVPEEPTEADADGFDEFDDFEAEFAAEANEAQYWFSNAKMDTVRKVHAWLEQVEGVGKVLSLGTMLEVGKTFNDGDPLDNFQLALLYNELPAEFAQILLKPYVSIEHNQVRFSLRIIDSDPDLRRDALLRHIRQGLVDEVGLQPEQVHLSGIMVLYNNMLQSLFDSQIATLGFMVGLLFVMFWLLFGSFTVAFVAMIANLIPIGVIFGFMGHNGIVLDMMTITIAAISIGIAVDDTIHYLYRFREEIHGDADYEAAMYRSHASIGYAMTYTSAAIIIGFMVLVLSVFIPTINFGLLTVLAMLLAILADLLLLPRLVLWVKPFKAK